MPYIKQERREVVFEPKTGEIKIQDIENAGELNYAISTMINHYFNKQGKGNYQAINDIVGALEGAKL